MIDRCDCIEEIYYCSFSCDWRLDTGLDDGVRLCLSTSMVITIGALVLLICWLGCPSSALTISIPDLVRGAHAVCTWTATSTDPSEFTLFWNDQSVPVLRNQQNSGQTDLGVFTAIGTYTIFARGGDSNTTPILDQTGFTVRATGSGDVSTSDTETITSPSGRTAQTSTDDVAAPTSTPSPVSAAFSSSPSKFATIKVVPSDLSLSSGSSTAVRPSSTIPGSDTPKSPGLGNYIPSLAGGTLAGLICLGLVTFWILRIRARKRHRELNPAAWTLHDQSVMWAKSSTVTVSAEKYALDDIIPKSDVLPTERQQNLQTRVKEIDRQLQESQAALKKIPDTSPELVSALITENTRLQTENQVLRDLNRSDWALALTDVPPPSYPHSRVSIGST
ncbi:hypothetical protein C8J56DRAFT_940170 [Mycena floridula]|nr:hypothetical protein C8J56DRAFT_940170 [Mycena floridula]